jgi:hypothetical protein
VIAPRFPIYIVSKGRWQHERRLTSRHLEQMGVPYQIVIEESEYDHYAAVIDPAKILLLDQRYKDTYDTFDDLGDTKSKGPGPARNYVWDHAVERGAKWHWVMDDNIQGFYRLHQNLKRPVGDGTMFAVMEDFTLRYMNVAIAGPNYESFIPRKYKFPPFTINKRIYSCNFIRNDIPYRWRGRYNEDTDLSLRVLKDGWCTIQFNAFLQNKVVTQLIAGGNTTEFYAKEGTEAKSRMVVKMHPDVARLTWKWHRIHHEVDYRPFEKNKLVRCKGVIVPEGVNDYGLSLKERESARGRKASQKTSRKAAQAQA